MTTNNRRQRFMGISAVMLVAELTIAGCAGQQARLTAENRKSLSSQPEVHAVHHSPSRVFTYESTGYSAASALFTPLLAIAQVYEGTGLQRDLRLEDPVQRAQDRLVSKLQAHFNVTNVHVVPDPPKNDQIATLKQVFQKGLVLDIRTMNWGLDNSRAMYSARARLLRLEDSTLLWQATCKYVADATLPSPSMASLKANDGELLKTKLLDAADGCADQLSAWAIAEDR